MELTQREKEILLMVLRNEREKAMREYEKRIEEISRSRKIPLDDIMEQIQRFNNLIIKIEDSICR